MKWQPIETAPKDGTPVILLGGFPCPNEDIGVSGTPFLLHRIGWYDKDRESRYEDADEWTRGAWCYCTFDSGYYGRYSEPPTHWISLDVLPEPPEGE